MKYGSVRHRFYCPL